MTIDPTSITSLCGVLPCSFMGGGAVGLSAYVLDRVVTAFEVAVVGVTIIMLFTAARWMVLFSNDETIVKDARTSYVYIITGLTIIGLTRWFVLAFSPANTGAALINVPLLDNAIGNVITYFKMIIALSLMVNIVLQAFRLITSQGQDDQVKKAKDRFIGGFVGAGFIMLANAIAAAVLPGTFGATAIAVEIVGIANYILVILGFMSLLAIVVAGVLLIVSIDEGLKDKAKNIIKTSIIGLIVVLISYALVTAFIAI